MDQQQPIQTRKEYNKLVRDKIPDILSEKGIVPYTHIARNSELEQALWDKVFEELGEAKADPCAAEFADILEVLYATAHFYNLTPNHVEQVFQRAEKETPPTGPDAQNMLWSALESRINEAKVRPQMETFVAAIDAVYAVAPYAGSSPHLLDQVRQQKFSLKGGFSQGIILEYVLESSNTVPKEEK